MWELRSVSENSYSTHKASGIGDLLVFFTLSARIKACANPPVAVVGPRFQYAGDYGYNVVAEC